MEDNRFPKEISLCLSGGAARGAYHLGVISVLQEHGVAIKAISGSSIGSLIGAALASGKRADEILEIFKSREFKKVFKFSFGKGYFFAIDINAPIIDKLTDKSSFEELDIPLEVTVVDIDKGEIEYVNSGGDLKENVLASCAIAPIIQPVLLNDRLLADGGIIDNLPVEGLKKFPYKILGINLFPYSTKRPTSVIKWIKKVFYLMWHSHNLQKQDQCDIYVSDIEINSISMWSFKDLDKGYALGRERMKKIISEY